MENRKLVTINKILKKIIFAFCLLTFAFALRVHAQSEQPPAPAAPRVVTVPKPIERTLKNGLRVIVVERQNVPLVTAQLLVKSGGEIDPENLAGAADMTAELLTKGTKTRSATEIAEQIDFLGGTINSGASWDFSSVSVRVMSDKLGAAMAIMADAVQNPAFAQEEIDRYKKQTLDELEVNLRQPGALANFAINRIILSRNYGHLLTGTPESINRISRENLVEMHKMFYEPANSVLIIAGDIKPETAFDFAQKNFESWKPQKLKNPRFVLVGAPTRGSATVNGIKIMFVEKITVIDLPSAGQAAVSVGSIGIGRDAKDYFPAIVTNSIFGGGYSARLNQEIRIKRGLSYGARSDLQTRRIGGIFSTRTQTKNESAAEVAQVVVDELTKLAGNAVEASELTPRKSVLTGDFARDLETTNGLVERIGELALYNLDLNQINSFIQNVETVSGADVQTFSKNLTASPLNIVIVGDAQKFLPDLQKRFAGTRIEVIPIAELDLNRTDLRKPKTNAKR
jgi:zinc protease